MSKLEVNHLTISFRTNNGAVRAVRDISFSLNEGETLAIAGESGSGKSVTTRAVMGILAGNAIIENGEIIYDGKDLLKISEEDFHTLRGHKLSMVFQDPLSALNPIMRIGNQLTEAMVLNNKELRRDGKARFVEKLSLLEKEMLAAFPEKADEKKAEISTYRTYTAKAVKMVNSFRQAQESAVEADDCIEEITAALKAKKTGEVKEINGRLMKAVSRIDNAYLLGGEAEELRAAVAEVASQSRKLNVRDSAGYQAALEKLHQVLARAEAKEMPDFNAIAYASFFKEEYDPSVTSVEEISREAKDVLEDSFMSIFRADCAAALEHSAHEAMEARKLAADVLGQELPIFTGTELNQKNCEASIKRMAKAVDASIDRLRVEKDNQSYVFHSSMETNCRQYFTGLKTNPREEKRFRKDTREHEKLVAAGKNASSVVPLNLVDVERARNNMINTVSALEKSYRLPAAETDYVAEADQLIAYMNARVDDSEYKLTGAMARHRAIELMKEVGIPEPQKRYTQYPFEFSGGMRQRIVIAIALSANPDILICDEPTTALDVTIQAQILELINRLKKQRKLSVIFITHDLGVVANMADRIAIMYAGKIVELGTANDVFYDPRHPYTWALLASMPDLETKEKLDAIPGTPPNMILPPKGDAFAARNKYALQIDFEEQPPMFKVSDTHWAATWLLHPNAPKVTPPEIVTERIERMKREQALAEGGEQA